MGGGHSRDAFTNDLRASLVGSKPGSQTTLCDKCSLFCPIPKKKGDHSLLSRRSSRSALSRNSSAFSSEGGFGTPLPDTPLPIRRIRDAALEKYYKSDAYHMSEEKKSGGGGSFGRAGVSSNTTDRAGRTFSEIKNSSDYERSSNYCGIEKEPSDMFPNEHTAQQQKVGGRQNGSKDAEIHDGKDAESKLHHKYELLEVLGVGSTSTCHRCIENSSGISRACKIVDKTDADTNVHTMMDQFYTEIKTLRSLQHPNIIQLFDVYITDDRIYIIMELMSGGELFDYVVQKGTLTEEEASRIVRKVTSALVYLHSRNVIHRDMKPENLLLAHKPRSSHDVEVKIIDFGLSKILSEKSGPVASSFLGTRGYLAPEMIQRHSYTKSVDAWALGVVIFVLLCGCLPFDDDCQEISHSPTLRTKFTLRFPRWAKDLSHSAKDLLNHLLEIDSRKRYTAEQAMEHPWVKGVTASKDSLLQSPGRIKPSPGGKQGRSSQATKDHVSQMVANRAIANAQLVAAISPTHRGHVRTTSI